MKWVLILSLFIAGHSPLGAAACLRYEEVADTFIREAKIGTSAILFTSQSPDKKQELVFAARFESVDGGDLPYYNTVLCIWPTAESLSAQTIFDRVDRQLLWGESPATVCWTDDSLFCAFTTTSSNGHSPWHFPAVLLDTARSRMFEIENVSGLVVGPELEIDDARNITVQVAGPDKSQGVDFDHPVSKTVSISSVLGESAIKSVGSSERFKKAVSTQQNR